MYSDGHVFDGLWEGGLEGRQCMNRYNDLGFYEGGWQTGPPQIDDFRSSDGTIPEKLLQKMDATPNGRRHGYGVMHFRIGDVYQGQWVHDFQDGRGVYYNAKERSVLMGEFRYGYAHGHGVKCYQDGSMYTGNFQNGNRVGVGSVMQPVTESIQVDLCQAATETNVGPVVTKVRVYVCVCVSVSLCMYIRCRCGFFVFHPTTNNVCR